MLIQAEIALKDGMITYLNGRFKYVIGMVG